MAFGIGNLYTRDLRRAERFLREGDGFFAVRNNVDFFAAQFANDGLHSHALHADTRANGIDVLVATEDRNLGAFARFPRGSADLHGAVVNFGNFHFKQTLHQRGIRARDDNLRAFGRAIHHANHDAKAFANVVSLELRLFALGQTRFGAAHVHDEVGSFGALDDDGDQFADAIVILIENGVALGFAHFLQDDLLGSLRGDTA